METGVFLKKRLYTAACALVLCAAMALPASAAGGYKDVPDDAWYAQAVADVSEKGYMLWQYQAISEQRRPGSARLRLTPAP